MCKMLMKFINLHQELYGFFFIHKASWRVIFINDNFNKGVVILFSLRSIHLTFEYQKSECFLHIEYLLHANNSYLLNIVLFVPMFQCINVHLESFFYKVPLKLVLRFKIVLVFKRNSTGISVYLKFLSEYLSITVY